MSSWSSRRKSIYAAIVIIVAVGVIGLPAFFIFYKPPTCADGKKNQGEQGIDCGGPCEKLCPSAFQDAIVSWTHFEKLTSHLYNIASYIVNPNISGAAHSVPFHVQIFDDTGMLITDVSSTLNIPPHRNTLAFLSAVDVGERIPAAATFEFKSSPDWQKQYDTLDPLVVTDKNYSEDVNGSSLTIKIENTSVKPIGPLSVYAVLYDKDKNAIGFSETKLDEIAPKDTAIAPFTWMAGHDGRVISIEALPVAE